MALAALILGWAAPIPADDGPYRVLEEIPIGGEGGWDYLTVDAAARRLYVSHATKVIVIDIDTDPSSGRSAPRPASTASPSLPASGGGS